MGESTRMVEKLVAECIQTTLEAKDAEAVPAGGK